MANDFAPNPNSTNAPSFLNYSRGVEDNTFSSLFRGVAEAVDVGAKAIDRGFTQQVKDEVRNAVETADASMLGIESNPRREASVPPPELAASIEKLKTARESMLSGRLSEPHYYARLHADAKRIRSRWGGADGASGYTEFIDDAFKELIGTTPANALRRETFAAEEAARASAAASRSSNQSFIDAVIKSGSTPPELADAIALPGMADNPEFMYRLKSGVAAREAERNLLEVSNLRIENAIKNGNLRKEDAEAHYAKSLSMKVYDVVSRGVTAERLQQLQKSFDEDRLAGRTTSPEQIQQMQALYNIMSNEVEGIIAKERASFKGFEFIREKAGAVEDMIRMPIKQIGAGLSDENFGAIKSATVHLKVLRDSAQAEILSQNESMRKLQALREIYGEYAFNWLATSKGFGDILKPASEVYEQALKADSALGTTTSLAEDIDGIKAKMARNPEVSSETGKVIFRALKALPEAIRDPKFKSEMKYNIAKKIYNPANKEMWANLAPKHRERIYRDLINPENYKVIQELAKRDPQLLRDYETTVIDFSYSVTREPISILNNIATSVSDRIVTFDETKNQVAVNNVAPPAIAGRRKEGDPITDFTQRAFNRVGTVGVGTAEVEINNVLKSFEPIWEAAGVPKERWGAEGRKILEKYGLRLGETGRNIYESIRGVETPGSVIPPTSPAVKEELTPEEIKTFKGWKDAGYTDPVTITDRMSTEDVTKYTKFNNWLARDPRKDFPEPMRLGLGDQPGRMSETTQLSAQEGTDAELDETIKLYNSTDNPKLKAALKQQIFYLITLDREKMVAPPPSRQAPVEDDGVVTLSPME